MRLSMRLSIRHLSLLLLLLCTASINQGCINQQGDLSPAKKYIMASDSYSTTVNALTLAGRTGALSKDFLRTKVNPIRLAVNAALDEFKTAVENDTAPDYLNIAATAYLKFTEKYNELLNIRSNISTLPPPPPPTDPSSNQPPEPLDVPN